MKKLSSFLSSLSSRRGFTLVELLVAMALFSIVIAIAVGGFVQAIRTQRQVLALISANSNASLGIEQIARELRTGFNFECVGGAPSECDERGIAFENAQGDTVIYRLAGEAMEREVNGVARTVTADNVLVRDLSFTILNNAQYPPRITMAITVSGRSIGVEGSATVIQTTISARQF